MGAAADDFTLHDIQGNTHRLADYRGKWVLVNLWATWRRPCLDEIPQLIDLDNAHHDKDLLVIGIAIDLGSKNDALPVSYLYGTKGEPVGHQAGEVTRTSIEAFIKRKQINRPKSNSC